MGIVRLYIYPEQYHVKDFLKMARQKFRREIKYDYRGKVGDWYVYDFTGLNIIRRKLLKNFFHMGLAEANKTIQEASGKSISWKLEEWKMENPPL